MKQSIVAIGLGMAIVAAGSTAAFAKKAPPCDVVGFWMASVNTGAGIETQTFTMSTNKKGVSTSANPECPKSTATNIKSTTIKSTTWNTTVTGNKKCAEVISTATTFDTGSCTKATGTLTIPGVATFPLTVTQTAGGVRPPHQSRSALLSGLK
jgi:hypothetical protein